jgi:hypothetical protein
MSELKEFEIWVEGFQTNGESSKASLLATMKAKSFEEAILIYAINDKAFYSNLEYYPNSNKSSDYRYWGCRLFDNESDARKAFG